MSSGVSAGVGLFMMKGMPLEQHKAFFEGFSSQYGGPSKKASGSREQSFLAQHFLSDGLEDFRLSGMWAVTVHLIVN